MSSLAEVFSEDKFPSRIITQPPLLHECPGTTSHHLNSLHIALTLRSSNHPSASKLGVHRPFYQENRCPRQSNPSLTFFFSSPKPSLDKDFCNCTRTLRVLYLESYYARDILGFFFPVQIYQQRMGERTILVLRDRDGGSGELLGLRPSYTLLMPWEVDT